MNTITKTQSILDQARPILESHPELSDVYTEDGMLHAVLTAEHFTKTQKVIFHPLTDDEGKAKFRLVWFPSDPCIPSFNTLDSFLVMANDSIAGSLVPNGELTIYILQFDDFSQLDTLLAYFTKEIEFCRHLLFNAMAAKNVHLAHAEMISARKELPALAENQNPEMEKSADPEASVEEEIMV